MSAAVFAAASATPAEARGEAGSQMRDVLTFAWLCSALYVEDPGVRPSVKKGRRLSKALNRSHMAMSVWSIPARRHSEMPQGGPAKESYIIDSRV